jgi:hypothetical protein
MRNLKNSRSSSSSSSSSIRRTRLIKAPPSAPPLSASIPSPFHATGQNFWAAVAASEQGNERFLKLTFGIEEPVLFDEAFLSQRRNEVQDMATHAFNSYLQHGFPADEVRPMTCQPHNMFLADGGGSGERSSVV